MRDCEHGQLARSCDRCEARATIARLTAELSELRARVEAAVELHRPIRNIISAPYWECPTCDELTDESGCKTRAILAPEAPTEADE